MPLQKIHTKKIVSFILLLYLDVPYIYVIHWYRCMPIYMYKHETFYTATWYRVTMFSMCFIIVYP